MLLYFLLLLRAISWFESQKCKIKPYHGARPCIFRQGITFHPNNLAHLHLCQHSQGVQVGSICRMQLKPCDMGVRWIFSTGDTGGFFQHFSRGGSKMVKFVFSRSKLWKQPFFWNFPNPEGGFIPPAPLPTPMPSDMSVSPSILRLF